MGIEDIKKVAGDVKDAASDGELSVDELKEVAGGVNLDQLRRENLDKDASNLDELRSENLDKD